MIGSSPRIAIDAMGGDHAPEEIVAGAVLAAREGLGHMILVGDEARIRPLVAKYRDLAVEIVHARGAIAMDAHPSQALRNSDDTSLGAAVNLVRDGKADAVVSAGNSGAFLAIALVRLRTIAGVARPAIAVVYPARHGSAVVLDSGANVDCRPEWLVQFGVMGSAYARAVLGVERPKVGIISNGEEATKGNALTIEAARLLRASPLNFIGNVEPKDLFSNVADVLVCDGFVGNVMLKLSEGAASLIGDIVVDAIKSGSIVAKLGALMVKPTLSRVRDRLSYDNVGGAPLLGLRGNCIVAHGRANATAVRSAIRAAVAEVREDVVGRIGAHVVPVDAREIREA
ncbi:MAG: phosphate acyltransferase PlsX [Vulcanimicrobiaceae bacterium]